MEFSELRFSSLFSGAKKRKLATVEVCVKEDEGFSEDDIIVDVEEDGPDSPLQLCSRNTTSAAACSTGESSSSNTSSNTGSSSQFMDPLTIDTFQDSSSGIKPEPFDSGYGVHDAMLNGYTDLFHEVDSLMNIKHEDHLNDTVFYLPMSCPGETSHHMELENAIQVSEALKSDLPSSLIFSSQDLKFDTGFVDSFPLGYSDDFNINLHSKEELSNIFDLKPGPDGGAANKPSCSAVRRRRRSADSGLGEVRKSASVRDSLNLSRADIVPATRKCRVKSGKSDSQSDDSGIAEPHSVSSSLGAGLSPFSESDGGMMSPVDVCSVSSSGSTSPKVVVDCNSEMDVDPEEEGDEEDEEIELEALDGDEAEATEIENKNAMDCCGTGSDEGIGDAAKTEPPDIDRFVICSDHTMECVLCSYTTDSYSAFKSHIICSHPCWRITKKLSKNRLLVERSIKNGVRIPSKKIGEKALPGDLDSTLTGGRKLNKKYIYRRQLFERNKRLFKCVLCLRLFVFEGSVVNHVTETHQEKVPYDFIHVSNDHGEHFGPIYRCPQKNCFFSADNEADLTKHHTERHLQVIYRCQLCGFTAETADLVRAHGLRMHKQQLACFVNSGPVAISQGTAAKSE